MPTVTHALKDYEGSVQGLYPTVFPKKDSNWEKMRNGPVHLFSKLILKIAIVVTVL